MRKIVLMIGVCRWLHQRSAWPASRGAGHAMRGLAVLLLWLAPAAAPEAVVPATRSAAPGAERARVLAMFARAYYPGRSGQIALVPRQDEFITRRGTEFMHGTHWEYDVRIPFVLWGPGRVRTGVFRTPVGAAGPRAHAGTDAWRRTAGRHRQTAGGGARARRAAPTGHGSAGPRRHARRLSRSIRGRPAVAHALAARGRRARSGAAQLCTVHHQRGARDDRDRRRLTFAEVRAKRDSLVLGFLLSRSLEHPKVTKTLRLSAHRTAHFVDVAGVADVDRDVRDWLTEAYACSPV